MNRLAVLETPIAGLKIVEHTPIGDERGFLSRLFCAKDLACAGWQKPVAQINHTLTRRCGTVRGMHFQYPPHAEMKLVSCIRGEIWDVAVDLRTDSPSFLQWHAEYLSGANGRAMLIPEGFAHGFQALTDNAELIYCHSEAYAAESEGGLHPLDARLAIHWPLPTTDLSARDANHLRLTEEFTGIRS